ncbi:MAG TPA: methyltransferase domain-containing protein [Vicinamibacterales bacterium]|nr:methyltransferase domain-containing protein [Vicinamibacterales bacterium]
MLTIAEQPLIPGLDRPASPAAHGRRFVTRAVDLRQPGAPEYVLGASTPERSRLLMQCELFKDDARWLLDQIGVGSNWWTIDVGCGPLGILDLLAERTGPGAEVIGLERDPNMLEFGHELMTDLGLSSVRLIQGDAHNTGLPASTFDLAHSRLLLVNVPDPASVVREMASITRPDGWVALEEVDWISWTCEPMHPAWTRLFDMNVEIWRKRGMDVYIGRRLPRMLMQAGLTDIQCRIHAPVYGQAHEYQFLLLAFSNINRTEMIEQGYTTEAEWTELTESLHEHLSNPSTFVTWSLFYQAWGRKPGQ